MTDTDEFEKALEAAFAKSDRLDGARAQVDDLTRALSRSVEKRTDGLVSVRLRTLQPGSIGMFMQAIVGIAPEDQMRRWVVACHSIEERELWRISFDKNEGYPVEVIEPEDETSHSCYAPEDLQRVFLELASAGVVGSRIKSLAATAPRQVKQLVDALQNDSTTGKLARELRVELPVLDAWVDYLSQHDCVLAIPAGDEREVTKTNKLENFTRGILTRRLNEWPPGVQVALTKS